MFLITQKKNKMGEHKPHNNPPKTKWEKEKQEEKKKRKKRRENPPKPQWQSMNNFQFHIVHMKDSLRWKMAKMGMAYGQGG